MQWRMRVGIPRLLGRVYLTFMCGLLQSAPAPASIVEWSIPGFTSWHDAQQSPLFQQHAFQTIDFRLVAGGIAPADTTQTVAVPAIQNAADPTPEEAEAVRVFGRHVARDSVFAQRSVVAGGSTLVHEGDLLLAPFADFPSDPQAVDRLRSAGVDSVRALVNVMHALLAALDQRSRQQLLTSPSIYPFLGREQLEVQLGNLIDGDPESAFVRIDQPGRDVKQKIVVFLDLGSRVPIGLVRFFPRPVGGVRINSYRIDANDGIAVIGGGGRLQHEPAYSLLQVEQSNTADTVAVRLQPAQYLQRFRFESLTSLDYDLSEFEVYSRGFVPTAVYLSAPLAFDRGVLAPLTDYLAGESDALDALGRLPGPTLGRVFWEEEQVGDPDKSRVVVSLQTGRSPETQKLFRVNQNGAPVEWRPNAIVVDHRDGVVTSGTLVNLDDPGLENSAQDIWRKLSDEEQGAVLTTTPEYLALPPAFKLDARGEALSPEPNCAFWSDFQPLTNGQLIPLPAGRPFFQVKVELTSDDFGSATFIKELRIEHDFRTVAREVKAEIVPAVDLTAGVDTSLIYALRPRLEPESVGFNRLKIDTPTRVRAVDKVEFGYGGVGGLERRQIVDAPELARTDSFFAIELPRIDARVARDDSLVVLVHFRARVLNLRTDFTGQVFLDTLGERERTEFTDAGMLISAVETTAGTIDEVRLLPQHVESGEVLDFSGDFSDRNTLQAITSLERQIEDVVSRVRVRPNPFTPNGDGINDRAAISYDVLRVTRPVQVSVDVFDLSGRRVRRFGNMHPIGEHTVVWDGTSTDGAGLVPPGTYIMRISALTDTGEVVLTRLISLVY